MKEKHSWSNEPPLALTMGASLTQDILDLAVENYAIKEIAKELELSEAEVRQVLLRFQLKLEEHMG